MENNKFLFISHSERDNKIISYFVDLLYQIGLKEENMFCSSISEIGVPIKEDIYDYLRSLLNSDLIIPIFMLSENYYDSAACLNEMGAVWIKQKDYFTFLLPTFEFKRIKGAINPNKRAIKLDNDMHLLKRDLSNFKDEICRIFELNISENRWERYRDDFLEKISKFSSDILVDINECEGYCINEINYGGCKVTVNRALNKVITDFDFSKTKSELCSLVFFMGGINIRSKFCSNKKLQFSLKASGDIKHLTVEMHLNNRNTKQKIQVSDTWEDYIISLENFGGAKSEWENLKEITFVVCRRLATKGSIEIKDIKIL